MFKKISIPKIFHSDGSGKPFEHCIDCNKYLLAENVDYIIEKAIKNYKDYNTQDTIFEYAICMDCSEKLYNSFSDTSRKAMDDYFEKNVDLSKRTENVFKQKEIKIDDLISNCLIKGSPINDLSEYQLVCHCRSDKVIVSYSPYMIGGKAIDEVVQLLSNKTIDQLGGFIDDNLGLPPEIKDILKDQPAFVF